MREDKNGHRKTNEKAVLKISYDESQNEGVKEKA